MAAIAKTQDLKKYGSKALLSDLVSSLKLPAQGVNIEVPKKGKTTNYSMLAVVVADTLAAQELGGFKEGVRQAVSPCSTCDIKNDNLQ